MGIIIHMVFITGNTSLLKFAQQKISFCRISKNAKIFSPHRLKISILPIYSITLYSVNCLKIFKMSKNVNISMNPRTQDIT